MMDVTTLRRLIRTVPLQPSDNVSIRSHTDPNQDQITSARHSYPALYPRDGSIPLVLRREAARH